MQSAHLPHLAVMLPPLLPGSWSVEALQAMQEANHQLRVLVAGQQVTGFAEFMLVADECQIFNIAVAPMWQRQGLGKLLLAAVLQEAAQKGMRRAVLEVRESNQGARQLYQQAGFVSSGRRPHYYSPLPGDAEREAAILYSCPLAL
jgi:ribosomal-protein-alanine N-acetyltransferase